MSSNQPDPTITPPPPGTPDTSTTVTERPHVQFSGTRWATTGIVRIVYRTWTRIAAHLFPEDSAGERYLGDRGCRQRQRHRV